MHRKSFASIFLATLRLLGAAVDVAGAIAGSGGGGGGRMLRKVDKHQDKTKPGEKPKSKPADERTEGPTGEIRDSGEVCGDEICGLGENPGTCAEDCVARALETNAAYAALTGNAQLFTLRAKRDLTVFSFDILGKTDDEGNDCRVYARAGGHRGHETSEDDWELVLKREVATRAYGLSRMGDLRPEVRIPAGATRAFYIYCEGGMRFAAGSLAGAPFDSDGSLVVREGVKASGLFQKVNGNTKFSGRIRYYISSGTQYLAHMGNGVYMLDPTRPAPETTPQRTTGANTEPALAPTPKPTKLTPGPALGSATESGTRQPGPSTGDVAYMSEPARPTPETTPEPTLSANVEPTLAPTSEPMKRPTSGPVEAMHNNYRAYSNDAGNGFEV